MSHIPLRLSPTQSRIKHKRHQGRSKTSYVKSPDFPIHLMGYWWLLWISISLSPLNQFMAPSWATVAQFLLLIASFFAGHAAMKSYRPFDPTAKPARVLRVGTARTKWALRLATTLCLVMLLASLYMAGALKTNFIEYFTRIRVFTSAGVPEQLTGSRSLDVLTKILAFPLSYTIIAITLAVGTAGTLRKIFIVSLINFLCFAYLWQVNYPLIHLFWLLFFQALIAAQQRGQFSKKITYFAIIVCIVLIGTASLRFGGDILGGIQRYIFGYHLVGFSFYDQQYLDPGSILHEHTFGRSSLGFLDQVLQALLKPFSVGYHAASFENADFTDTAIDIGAKESQQFNAFGTIIFTLYRDFHLPGIAFGGFIYGAVATFTRYRCQRSWWSGALFLMLASAWMMGMMVSPLEAAYFWFVIVALALFNVVNRGVRWSSSTSPRLLQSTENL